MCSGSRSGGGAAERAALERQVCVIPPPYHCPVPLLMEGWDLLLFLGFLFANVKGKKRKRRRARSVAPHL